MEEHGFDTGGYLEVIAELGEEMYDDETPVIGDWSDEVGQTFAREHGTYDSIHKGWVEQKSKRTSEAIINQV